VSGLVEQRQYPRYLIQLPVLFKTSAAVSNQVGAGWTRNMSEGGACLEVTERFGSLVPLQLLLRTD